MALVIHRKDTRSQHASIAHKSNGEELKEDHADVEAEGLQHFEAVLECQNVIARKVKLCICTLCYAWEEVFTTEKLVAILDRRQPGHGLPQDASQHTPAQVPPLPGSPGEGAEWTAGASTRQWGRLLRRRGITKGNRVRIKAKLCDLPDREGHCVQPPEGCRLLRPEAINTYKNQVCGLCIIPALQSGETAAAWTMICGST